MFNIGIGELAVICIILIIAVGPERLPTMMKTVGKTVRALRQASRDIRAQSGIDELMRDEMFDARPPARRPIAPIEAPAMVSRVPGSTFQLQTPPSAAPEPGAVPGAEVAAAPKATSPAASAEPIADSPSLSADPPKATDRS